MKSTKPKMVSSTNSTTATNRDWSSLPEELWSMIGDNLNGDRFDVTRFRSVCTGFRSKLSKFEPSSSPQLPRFSISIRPFPSNRSFVSLTTVYKLHRPLSAGGAWLVKVSFSAADDDKDKIVLLDFLSCRKISEIDAVRSLRLSDFRISEVARTYSLRHVRGSSSVAGVNKVILCPKSGTAFVIYENGKLGFAKNGDGDITPIDSRIVDYNDVILFRNQPYVADRWGTVSWIDESMKLIQFSTPMFGDGGRKHLVVCDGELYVAERYLSDVDNDNGQSHGENRLALDHFVHGRRRRRRRLEYPHPKSVNFKVFKLDEEWGRWVEVKNLGDKSLVVTYDCSFSVSASELDGFEGNCIYFTEQFDMDLALRQLGRLGGCVFRLEDGTIQDLRLSPGYSNIFPTLNRIKDMLNL